MQDTSPPNFPLQSLSLWVLEVSCKKDKVFVFFEKRGKNLNYGIFLRA